MRIHKPLVYLEVIQKSMSREWTRGRKASLALRKSRYVLQATKAQSFCDSSGVQCQAPSGIATGPCLLWVKGYF